MGINQIASDELSARMEKPRHHRFFATAISYAFAHVLLWSALSFQYYVVENQPPNLIGSLFAALFSLGHFFICGLLFLLVLMPIFLILKDRSAAFFTAAALGMILTSLLISDIIVHTLFKTHLSPGLVGIFLAASPFEIYDPPMSFYATVLTGLAVIAIVEIILLYLARRYSSKKCNFSLVLLLTAALLVSNAMHAVAVVKAYPPVLARAVALPYAFPLSARSLLTSLGVEPVYSPHQWGEELLGAGLDYPKAEVPTYLPTAPGPEPLNIIIILIDSWRIASFNEEIMPRLYERSKKAIVFEKHLSGGNATRCGVFSMFYGLPASYFHTFNAERREPILMEKLQESGYDFGIYSSASLTPVDIAQTAFTRLKDKVTIARGSSVPEKDAAMEENFLAHIHRRDRNKPFFGFAFYDLLHGKQPFPDLEHPFQPAAPWDHLKFANDIDPQPYLNAYNNAAYTLDIHLDSLLDELDTRGLFKNSVVIITGDHGEEINDSRTNAWGHNSNFSSHQVQTPLLIFWPGRAPGKVSYLTRHYDLPVTLMEDVLGTPPKFAEYYTLGVNIFNDDGRDLTICSSYNDKAIIHDDNVFVLKKYGLFQTYSFDGHPNQTRIPPLILKKALDEMRYFYSN